MAFKNITKLVSGVGLGLIASFCTTVPVKAQQFTVTPLVTIGDFKAGQAKGSISVTNKGAEPLRMRIYAESFTYDRKQGFTFTPKDDRSAVPYLQFSPREIEVPPGVTRNVRVAITIPPNLPNQEYRAAVFIEDLKEREIRPSSGNTLVIKARVASVFFFNKGESKASIQLRTVVWDATNKTASILLENQGKQTAYPEVSWSIAKAGREVAKNTIRGVIVQSENSREVTLQSNDQPLSLAKGEYVLSGDIVTKGQKPAPFSVKFAIP